MAIFKKGSKGYSIVNMKCPRCHEEDVFETSTFSYSKPFDMRLRCSTCDLNYMPEPGFYYGSMFISYIIWGWFSIILVGGLIYFYSWSVEGAFAVLIAISAVLFVWLYRISRTIWMNINFKYNPAKIKKMSTRLKSSSYLFLFIKRLVFYAIVFLCFTLAACKNNSGNTYHHDGHIDSKLPREHVKAHGDRPAHVADYVCPLHCEGSGSDKPGICTVCGFEYESLKDHISNGHNH